MPSPVGRGAYVTADQALSSLTNFALSFVVLRAVTAQEFGAFTLGLSAYFIALGISRALCGEPQVVRYSQSAPERWRSSTQSATGLAVMLGIIGAALLFLTAVQLGGPLATTLILLALALPGLLLQDAWRYAFFSAGKPSRALANDLVWALLLAGPIVWLIFAGTTTSAPYLIAWGASGTLSALFGVIQAGTWPSLTRASAWLSSHRDLGPRFTAEFLLGLGAAQLTFLAIAAISGLAAVGTLNAARVLLGPFNVVLLGSMGFAVPEGARILRSSPGRFTAAARVFGLVLSLLALSCGALIFFLPDSVARSLVGEIWPHARRLVPLLTVYLAASGFAEGARVGLRVMAASRRSLRARVLTAPFFLAGGVVGAATGDALGASAGIAAAHCVSAYIWWQQFRSAQNDPVSDPEGPFETTNSMAQPPGTGPPVM